MKEYIKSLNKTIIDGIDESSLPEDKKSKYRMSISPFDEIGKLSDELENKMMNEFSEWIRKGGKVSPIDFKLKPAEYGQQDLFFSIGNERFGQRIEENSFWSIDEYKKALENTYSFMNGNPQYYKYRKLDGMLNPLQHLIYSFITK